MLAGILVCTGFVRRLLITLVMLGYAVGLCRLVVLVVGDGSGGLIWIVWCF